MAIKAAQREEVDRARGHELEAAAVLLVKERELQALSDVNSRHSGRSNDSRRKRTRGSPSDPGPGEAMVPHFMGMPRPLAPGAVAVPPAGAVVATQASTPRSLQQYTHIEHHVHQNNVSSVVASIEARANKNAAGAAAYASYVDQVKEEARVCILETEAHARYAAEKLQMCYEAKQM